MKTTDHILYLLDELKVPTSDPFSPEDWKDWYHYILFDPATQTKMLVNVCMSGRPGNGVITTTVFLTVPGFLQGQQKDFNTYGFCVNAEWEAKDIVRVPLCINTGETFLSIQEQTNIKIKHKSSGISLQLTAEAAATPIYIPELAPFGKGFIGWGLVPGMLVAGKIHLHDLVIDVNEKWYCYHDHNFGRFNWGDDIGWTWFVSTLKNNGSNYCYVLHRGNNKDFSRTSPPFLFIYENKKLKKVFMGDSINLRWEWDKNLVMPPVLPGAMASLFADRALLKPSKLIIDAADDNDYCYLKMETECFTEMILPDYEKKQYTFLKEINGKASAIQRLDKKKQILKKGFFYAELVH